MVSDIRAYDDLYQQLIAKIDLHDVSSMFTMEQIKSTTELPLVNASTRPDRHEARLRDIRSSRHERRPMLRT